MVGVKGICYQFEKNGLCSYGERCKYRHIPAPTNEPGTDTKTDKPKSRRRKQKSSKDDPITRFFSGYPGFDYRKNRPITEEFYRMCGYFGWNKGDDAKDDALREFKTAMVFKFNNIYGTDTEDIECWHRLCVAVDINPLPTTIVDCKKVIRNVHVNLVDLVDTSGQQVELFDCLDDLREYTTMNGKYFPKQSAYAGGVLKFLLREIYNKHQKSNTQRVNVF